MSTTSSSTNDFLSKVNAILALPPTVAPTPPTVTTIRDIPVDKIQTDRTQSRASMDEHSVDEYAARMEGGNKFPAAVVFRDGEHYWLADGFHRLAAAKKARWNYLKCEVHQGGWRDALKYSLAANQTHGVRRTNADKWHAVQMVLADDEWCQFSDHLIAEMCGVSHPFVGKVRDEFGGSELVTVTSSTAHTDAAASTSNGLQLNPSKRLGRDRKMRPATQPKLESLQEVVDPDGDISFNPVELEAETAAEAESLAKLRAEGEKKIKSGSEMMVPIPLVKKAERAFGGLVRAINDLARHPHCKINKRQLGCNAELTAILEAIMSVNGPVESVDGGWALKDGDDDGLAARTIVQVMHGTVVRARSVGSDEGDEAVA